MIKITKLPLLLIPGLLCDADTWSYQSHHLSDIADIIIPNLNNATTPQEMVASALQAAPLHFALAGHSMGGWVALEVVKQCPERVLGLCLLNTTAMPDSKEKHNARQSMISSVSKGDTNFIIEKLMQLYIHNNDAYLSVKKMLKRNINALINQEQAMLQREDCIKVLDTITCPTLIIHSANDAIFQYTDSAFLATKIKHATFSTIENCGHMSPMESPEQVTQLIRLWLKTLSKHDI